jgi:hypothetical protein
MVGKHSKRSKCIECGAPLPALRLQRHAVTCSVHCAQVRQRRMDQRRYSPKYRMRCKVCRKWFRSPSTRSTCSVECKSTNDRLTQPSFKERPRNKQLAIQQSSSRVGSPTKRPPLLGISLTEAAERIGVSRTMAYTFCEEHGIGQLCDDGRFWLTLAELRTLTVSAR